MISMKKSLHILLTELIDYAGLFPPAALDLPQAFRNYDSYKVGGDAWALGRFVLPAARLDEFADAAPHNNVPPWHLSALLSDNADLDAVTQFNDEHAPHGFVIDTVEFKAAQPAAIDDVLRRLPPHIAAYVEIPIGDDPQRLIDAIGAAGARAKVRTGGVTPHAFPRPDDLLRFLHCCIEARVPFKATAGLHHPVRDRYRLTYDVDSPSATMYGFLNVFLTAAFLLAGLKPDLALPILTESDPNAFRFDDGVQWRDHRLDLDHLATARQLAISFGSCSFEEPLAALRALGLLASDE
jgi:hypothetical protein